MLARLENKIRKNFLDEIKEVPFPLEISVSNHHQNGMMIHKNPSVLID